MRLISNPQYIRDNYGFDPFANLLIPNIRMDSPLMATPVVAATDAGEYVLSRQQELGSLLSQGVPMDRIRLFEGYVTLDPALKSTRSAKSFAAAVEELARPGEAVAVDGGFPYSRYLALKDAGLDVRIEEHGTTAAVVAYRLDTGAVLRDFRAIRARGIGAARALVESLPQLDGIQDEFTDAVDSRYSLLEKIAAENGVAAVLSSARPNFSELTGFAAREGLHALWVGGTGELYVIGPATDYSIPGVPTGTYSSLSAAIRSLAGDGATGIEEHRLGAATADALHGAGVELAPLSLELGKWRDLRDHEDLPFQLIAARASTYCISGALKHAEETIAERGYITENEAHAKYRELIHAFRAEHGIPFALEPFFVNLHAADRSLYPGPPTDFRITAGSGSVKLDAGLKVTHNGVVLATSDMARSLVTTDEAREGYEFFLKVVREDIIGALHAGKDCEVVHREAVEAVLAHRQRLIELNLLAEETDFAAEYGKRNVGHLMGKQESFGLEFKPGHPFALPARSLGAAEIQWSFGNYSIGAEDMWYIGADRVYNTTI
ncbi:hypothetical protein GCM10023081_44920 [Arthrobacter ginkgonis]|uniref:Xaa-Pro aminopeptidase n=1 Tax=Arthrobacter ginkgonis TaxID=1630594 RepID=A0ABP7DEY7_9MICC